MHLLLTMRRLQQIDEILNKLLAVILNIPLRVLADEQDLSDVAFTLDVTISKNISTQFSWFVNRSKG